MTNVSRNLKNSDFFIKFWKKVFEMSFMILIQEVVNSELYYQIFDLIVFVLDYYYPDSLNLLTAVL